MPAIATARRAALRTAGGQRERRLRAGETDRGSGRRGASKRTQSRARRFDQPHGGQELVSPAGYGLDVLGRLGVVAQRTADLDDALDEDVVGHERIGPELLHQLRLRHDPSRVAREVAEGLEWLGGQRDHALVFHQAARLGVQCERPEDEPRGRRRPFALRGRSGNFGRSFVTSGRGVAIFIAVRPVCQPASRGRFARTAASRDDESQSTREVSSHGLSPGLVALDGAAGRSGERAVAARLPLDGSLLRPPAS